VRRNHGALALPLAAALVAGCDSSGTLSAAPPAGVMDASTDAATDASLDATSDDAESGSGACANAGSPPTTLDCTGLYADFATLQPSPGAMAYTPSTPLWSDGAQKQRWIILPPGSQIDVTNPDEWTFPVGTKLFKEFRVGGQRVETRMFQKLKANDWTYATYAWSADASSATINYGGPVPVGDSGTWNIPTNDDCLECHKGRQDRILGFEQVGLGLPTAQGLTLAVLAQMGLVTPAPVATSLTIGDDGTGLDSIAMGWLHVNCGVTCHNSNPSAAGYGAGMLLRLDPTQLDGSPPNPGTWDILSTTLNVPCQSGSVAGQPRILPGNAAASVIHQLIDERGALQMPPIASLIVDTPDTAVVAAWINAMGAVESDDGGPPDDAEAPEEGGHRHDGGRPDGGFPHDEAGVDATSPESGASGQDAGPGQDGGTGDDAGD
jgi:hypothetical protein